MIAHRFRTYLEALESLLTEAREQSDSAVSEAADRITAAIMEGRVLYVFGPSHAGLLAQDLFYRAGGLMAIEPIMPAGLLLNSRPVTHTSYLERLPGYGTLIMKDRPIGPGDVVLVISVSGRNPVVVEVCSAAQEKGATVIALTSLTYSRSVTPRSGDRKLFEVADVVIDLPGAVGDAAVTLDGVAQPVGPTSTAIGSAILQGLMVEVVGRLDERGYPPPVLISGNLDHADEQNRALFDRYRRSVSYL